MKVLVVHNRYAFRGGEDQAFATEIDLLKRYGHEVFTYIQENRSINGDRDWATGLRAIWSRMDYSRVRQIIRSQQIRILSVHNFFPLVSPSVYYAARDEGIPVVQTLHNYRLLCPAATFFRDGGACEDCSGKSIHWPGVLRACYRSSRVQTAGVAAMTSVHRWIGTWNRVVSGYIALTSFMRDKFVDAGFPADRIFVKPNSVEDTGLGDGGDGSFVFVGRLTMVKGLEVLLKAWPRAGVDRKLKIIGTGPDELTLRAAGRDIPNLEFLGELSVSDTRDAIGRAAAVVFPSLWYEGLSRVVTEAFSKGTPVIASDIGPIARIIVGGSGIVFRTGDAEDLARIIRMFPLTGEAQQHMRVAARAQYEEKYSDWVVYQNLMGIYGRVLDSMEGENGGTRAAPL